MIDELTTLQREITVAHAGLAAKEVLLKRLMDEIPRDQAHLNGLLARHAELRRKLPAPQSTGTQPQWYDTIAPEGGMGDRRITN
jgi:hypothetical protein